MVCGSSEYSAAKEARVGCRGVFSDSVLCALRRDLLAGGVIGSILPTTGLIAIVCEDFSIAALTDASIP